MTNYIALSIPAFFGLLGLELVASRVLKKGYYRLADTLADLGCGTVQQIFSLFVRVVLVGAYAWIWEKARLLELPAESAWTWALCFLAVDFAYYWFHRLSHEVAFLWAAHVVHHQSEDYNLAVALRQSAFQPLFSAVFYWPLAILGFPPVVFATMAAMNTLYQFWIHTRFIGRLGPLEWILCTPSHHRVHHGRNPEYLDRNHGGTFIIWDRLFGTFEQERAQVVYGITEPVRSWNPVWANLGPYRDLVRDTLGARTLLDRIKLWLKPPGWKAPSDPAPEQRSIALDAPRHESGASRGVSIYVLVQFVLVLGLAVPLIQLARGQALWVIAPLGAVLILSLGVLGGLLDGRRWARRLEPVRLVLAVIVLAAPRLVGG